MAKEALKKLVRERLASVGAKVKGLKRFLDEIRNEQTDALRFHQQRVAQASQSVADLVPMLAGRHQYLEEQVKDLLTERRVLNNRVRQTLTPTPERPKPNPDPSPSLTITLQSYEVCE